MWQATSKVDTARSIGRAGDALQLHRFASGGPTGTVQKTLVDAYSSELPSDRSPRIGVSRSVLPAESKADAVRLFTEHLERDPGATPWITRGSSPSEILRDFYILHGSPEEIAAELVEDAAVSESTDYLFSVPLALDDKHYRESLAVIAGEIYPTLSTVRPNALPRNLLSTSPIPVG